MPTPMQKLEAERDMLRAMVEEYDAYMRSISHYLLTEKFRENSYVNVQDILSRITEAGHAVGDIEFLPWGMAHPIKGLGGPSSAWDSSCPMDKHGRTCGERTYSPNVDPFTGKAV